MIKKILACAVTVFILGCSASDDQKEQKAKETIFDPQINAMKKAQGVDKQIEDSAAKQRKEIEEQGG